MPYVNMVYLKTTFSLGNGLFHEIYNFFVPFMSWIINYINSPQERFSDPKSLVKDLHLNGFKAIWMLDPGIKQEDGYLVHDSGSANDVWIHKADGTPFVGIFSLQICILGYYWFSGFTEIYPSNFRGSMARSLCFPWLYSVKSSFMVGLFSQRFYF